MVLSLSRAQGFKQFYFVLKAHGIHTASESPLARDIANTMFGLNGSGFIWPADADLGDDEDEDRAFHEAIRQDKEASPAENEGAA